MEILALGLSAISVLFILLFGALNYRERLREREDKNFGPH